MCICTGVRTSQAHQSSFMCRCIGNVVHGRIKTITTHTMQLEADTLNSRTEKWYVAVNKAKSSTILFTLYRNQCGCIVPPCSRRSGKKSHQNGRKASSSSRIELLKCPPPPLSRLLEMKLLVQVRHTQTGHITAGSMDLFRQTSIL